MSTNSIYEAIHILISRIAIEHALFVTTPGTAWGTDGSYTFQISVKPHQRPFIRLDITYNNSKSQDIDVVYHIDNSSVRKSKLSLTDPELVSKLERLCQKLNQDCKIKNQNEIAF